MNNYSSDMDWLRIPLENALNSTHPMRSINPSEWCYAGNFFVVDKTYAFIGSIGEGKVTCRCIDKPDYANHWFQMNINWVDNERHITVTRCI